MSTAEIRALKLEVQKLTLLLDKERIARNELEDLYSRDVTARDYLKKEAIKLREKVRLALREHEEKCEKSRLTHDALIKTAKELVNYAKLCFNNERE